MNTPIGLQLYSVRENLSKDFIGTIKKVADMGYQGVETAGFPEGVSPKDAKKIFDDLNLPVISAHSPLPLGEDKHKILDALAAVGCPHYVSPWMNPENYSSRDKMRELADTFNTAYAVVKENGMKFSIHNHAFEFALFEGEPAIFTLMEYLDPAINFELDTYWIKVAGVDPSEIVTKIGARAPLLHIKDGPATHEGDMTAVGDGVVDVPGIIAAGSDHTEWLIVELDRCATDMLAAVGKSQKYLASLKS